MMAAHSVAPSLDRCHSTVPLLSEFGAGVQRHAFAPAVPASCWCERDARVELRDEKEVCLEWGRILS